LKQFPEVVEWKKWRKLADVPFPATAFGFDFDPVERPDNFSAGPPFPQQE
jgi:hypothetical protein